MRDDKNGVVCGTCLPINRREIAMFIKVIVLGVISATGILVPDDLVWVIPILVIVSVFVLMFDRADTWLKFRRVKREFRRLKAEID